MRIAAEAEDSRATPAVAAGAGALANGARQGPVPRVPVACETVREALARYYTQRGLLAPGETVDDRLSARWVYMRLLGRSVPVKPLLGHQGAFLLHDVHHMIAGYGTTYREELAQAAWELGSGGCGYWLLFWNNRILAVAHGMLICPVRIVRAFRAGQRCRNLYRRRAKDVLDMVFEEVRRYVDPSDSCPSAASAGAAAG